jgi:hypothetical protein
VQALDNMSQGDIQDLTAELEAELRLSAGLGNKTNREQLPAPGPLILRNLALRTAVSKSTF